ncbi:MAG: MBL fold metallo-hydrolase [Saprospiraceae bacterium]|nr:MBL fold metallo-hydrolase [Saprospiraceae bacterium]
MKIQILETGYFKLDGGAMFGIVPKPMWERKNPPDEKNLCTWSMRCLLVQTEGRNIIFDTGLGDKQDAKFRSFFEPHGTDSLIGSLQQKGLQPEEITDVFITHLHFDHVGGAISRDESGSLIPTFPNATYWTNEVHWNWALNPNPREAASFLQENILPLKHHNVLSFIDVSDKDVNWLPGIDIRFVYGHTEAMMVPIFTIGDKRIIYCADVLPSSFHIGLPWIMSYDIRPLDTLSEKKKLLEEALDHGDLLLFEHDPKIEGRVLGRNAKGRIVLDHESSIASFLAG